MTTETKTDTCPICGEALWLFYSMNKEQFVCCCENERCRMYPRWGTGDRSQDAIDSFVGLSLR